MSISWACVARDSIILAEAGADDGKGSVVRTARKISTMKPTCGWEMTRSLADYPYRGIKFHVNEVDVMDIDRAIIWSFCCVYNSKITNEKCAKNFLSKLVLITKALRIQPWWREGMTLAAQVSFAPTLKQLMGSAERDYKLSTLNQHVEEMKLIMQRNIEAVIEKGVQIDDLENKAEELDMMSKVFKKNARKMKRYQLSQSAKHGCLVGGLITGVIGVVCVPPLIALL